MKQIIAVLFLAVLSLSGCGESEPAKSLKDVSRNIDHTARDGGKIVVALRSQGGDGGEGDMTRVAIDIKDIGAWQMTHGGGVETGLIVNVKIPTKDKYGNEDVVEGIHLSLTAADLRKINWKNISHWDVLNLSSVTFVHPFGQKIAARWCVDKQNLEYSGPFCQALLKS